MTSNRRRGNRFKPPPLLTAVVANQKGEIFDLDGYASVGADGTVQQPLSTAQTQPLPYGSELMYLPDRIPLVYDLRNKAVIALAENPYEPGEAIFPVAAFNSPGYLITHTCAYTERARAGYLPLFSYGAIGWHKNKFRSAVVRVDEEPRQDLRRMPLDRINNGVRRMRRQMPENRLLAHLEKCALTYGCPAGKNFFLARYEAPLPTSSVCNARCLGCISLQTENGLTSSQNRIDFTPSPAEIAEVALAHINKVHHAVVSFGQGCEGDPLMAADTICEAVRLIRTQTDQGTINMNTNGSLPDRIERLLDAGMDSLRISMNSVRPACYETYFRPNGYGFGDVVRTIDLAGRRGVHVAINYLNCPGFTDTTEEYDALGSFLSTHPISMIQWRNLNFDPLRYLAVMDQTTPQGRPMGMVQLLSTLQRRFPNLTHGYFNPPKIKF